MKRIFLFLLVLAISNVVLAQGGRYAVEHAIAKDPSILLEPWFWGVIIFGVICVIIYEAVKDKK